MTDNLPRIPQLARDDLRAMSPEQINEAMANGQLDEVLGRPVRVDLDALGKQAGVDDQ